jgi:CarD family transcriptional regulator
MAARMKKISNASSPAEKDSKRGAGSDGKSTRTRSEATGTSEPRNVDAKSEGMAKDKSFGSPAKAGAATSAFGNSAAVGNYEAEIPARSPAALGGDDNSTAEPTRAQRKSTAIETQRVEMKPVSAPGKPGKTPGATGAATAANSAAVAKSGTDAGPALGAPAVESSRKLAAPKAAPASAKSDRDEQNGDQKTMKTTANRHGFKLNEFVVYPAHGVGQIVSMEEQEVAGFKLELFVINFVKDKMTLRVPTSKVAAVGMRKLSDSDAARRSLEILTGRARVKRTMWSRRAQEYEAKINSGDINAIAEVVRDLFRSDAQPEQSYSERQLYEAALDRMMREIAAVHKLTETEALKMIEGQLKKNVKRPAKPEGTGGEAEEADIEEAA